MECQDAEREVQTYRANRTQGNRAVGGHLLVTSERLVFSPHGFDDATGGKSWECRLVDVTKISLAARGLHPFNGAWRRRVQIDLDTTTEYFVVNKATGVIATIQAAIRASGSET